jgi:hypothetical protein
MVMGEASFPLVIVMLRCTPVRGLRHCLARQGDRHFAFVSHTQSSQVRLTQDQPGAFGSPGGDFSAFKTAAFDGGRSSVIVCRMISGSTLS